MTSTWQKPRSESTLNYDVVESLEYRPITLSEDIKEEVGAREDEEFSQIIEEQPRELGTPCQQSPVPARVDEGLPFECPLLLTDDDSLRNTDVSINLASTKTVPIEGEKRCTSEGYLVNSTLDRCNQLLAAEIETVGIQVPPEGATQPQHEIVDDLPILVDSNHNPENIVELITDAMEGCYVNASNGQSCETVPFEHDCWDTQPINCDLIADVRLPETSCLPEGEDSDITILAKESLQDEFPVCAIEEDSEILLGNIKEHSITLSTLVDGHKGHKPRAKDGQQIRVNDKPLDQNSDDQSRGNCPLDAEDWNPTHSSGQQWTLQCDAEKDVGDNNIDGVKKGTCLDKLFRPVYANKPASHGTQFIESLAPPMCLSLHQAPLIEVRGYHSEGHLEESEHDHIVYTSSSESTTSSTAFVKAMNLRNRQKSNIFKNPNSVPPMPPLNDGANDLAAVLKSGEAQQDPSHKCHSDFLKESLHSDETNLSQEILPCSDSNRADNVDLEGTTSGGPVILDQTDALITEVTVHPPPDSENNQTKEDRQIVCRHGLEDSIDTNNEIISPDQSEGQDRHIVRESNDLNDERGKHCVLNTCRNIASTVCNVPPQVEFGVLQTPSTKPLDVEDEVGGESGQIAKDQHQTHPPMSSRPFDQPGHPPRHDNNLPRVVGAARSPSRKVERLRRRELYRLTREVMLQKDYWESMHRDALGSVDEFNLVRQEVARLYNRLDNNQTNFFSEQQCSLPN